MTEKKNPKKDKTPKEEVPVKPEQVAKTSDNENPGPEGPDIK